jgi:hypothetical protein
LRNLDLDLEHFEIVLPLETHADVIVGNLHVLRNDRDEFALQRGQVIGRRMPAAALVRDDELQTLRRDRRRRLLLAEQERQNRHIVRPP